MVTILGATGMLGSMLKKTWQGKFWAPSREVVDADKLNDTLLLDGRIINCIGVIKPYCDDVSRAIRINALFPHSLPADTLQIATDCVFSGKQGSYVETDVHDAGDVYGKTKSLGEASHLNNLRCSIIGPEIKNHLSLLDWFLSQEKADGFTNHLWNGITTYHFSKIVQGVIREAIELPDIQHIVPADIVSKAELLESIAKAFYRNIPVNHKAAPQAINRTLSTNNPELNFKLWKAAGYSSPPSIIQMLEELALLK